MFVFLIFSVFFIRYYILFLPGMPHKRVIISLPFSKENEAQWLIPMGETINHPKPEVPLGHPGIDFAWDHTVPIIAVADGVIKSVKKDSTEGKAVWNIYVASGDYLTGYTELESYNTELYKGSKVSKGMLIGYPNEANHQIHWEFEYNTPLNFLIEPLCPMTYFDEEARSRIESIWENQGDRWPYKDKFPYICSGDFYGKDA